MKLNTDFFDEVQQWWVVFTPRRQGCTSFIQGLINQDFCHVLLLRETPDGKTMIVDPLNWGLGIAFTDQKFDDALLQAATNATAVLGYTADYRRNVMPIPRFIVTCVTACRAVLGLADRGLTPYAFYKELLRKKTVSVVKAYTPYVGQIHGCV